MGSPDRTELESELLSTAAPPSRFAVRDLLVSGSAGANLSASLLLLHTQYRRALPLLVARERPRKNAEKNC